MTTDPTGASCPFCHFPIKAGTAVHACERCEAPHHAECWTENQGCAVTGCAAGPTTTLPPGAPGAKPTASAPRVAPLPSGSAAWGPPPAPTASEPRTGRWIAAGAAAVLVLALVGTGAYFLTSGGDDGPSDSAAAVTTQTATTSVPADAQKPDGPSDRERAAEQLAEIMELSAIGRQASVAQELDAALANRERVIRRIRAVAPASSAQQRAADTFLQAMQASRRSIVFRQEGNVGRSQYDVDATRLKESFCRQWQTTGMATLTGHGCRPDAI